MMKDNQTQNQRFKALVKWQEQYKLSNWAGSVVSKKQNQQLNAQPSSHCWWPETFTIKKVALLLLPMAEAS